MPAVGEWCRRIGRQSRRRMRRRVARVGVRGGLPCLREPFGIADHERRAARFEESPSPRGPPRVLQARRRLRRSVRSRRAEREWPRCPCARPRLRRPPRVPARSARGRGWWRRGRTRTTSAGDPADLRRSRYTPACRAWRLHCVRTQSDNVVSDHQPAARYCAASALVTATPSTPIARSYERFSDDGLYHSSAPAAT